MNASGANSSGEPAWPRRRWLAVFAVFAGLQGALLTGLIRWPRLPDPPPLASHARLEISAYPNPEAALMSGDPRQFAAPDPEGFSGSAARSFPPPEYTLSEWPGRPRWLSAEGQPSRVGDPRPAPVPPSLRAVLAPPVAILGETPAPVLLPTHTQVEPRGALAGRGVRGRTPPPVLAGTDVLNPTVIEVAATPSGEVLIARVTGASGNPEADQRALVWTQTARFPAMSDPSSTSVLPDALTWGELAFLWRVQPATP
ncbi:MAG: hypothetical protein JNL10_02385 [Verrucomicrobiales bacterium]|nr:hypothetical protein [Verrucomicrobiales bacterium]